ncbi:MAG: PQQ-like beta-propeller repeat protein, partial [Planctomycetes bacterium]|nr:PQQ-like beta-propeller repeat protein [Planctomycetota bacterium]
MNRRISFAVLALVATVAHGDSNWPQWRGPDLNGVSGATGLPTTWSPSENIIWKAALPTWSGSSPIVWGEHVFITSPSATPTDAKPAVRRRLPGRMGGRSDPGGPDLLLFCFNARDGSLRWKKKLGSGNRLFGKHNMASPSPVTDGTRVVTMIGTGLVAAFDFDGKQLWQRDLAADYGEPAPAWGYGSSPILYEGKVIVPVMHGSNTSTPSYVVALDIENGKTVWKVARKTDAARECPDAYTTPVISRHDGRTDLVILGADYVTGHDPATGKEIWRAGGMNPEGRGNYRIVASPVAVAGMIFTPTRQKPFLAFRAGGTGDVSESHRLWSFSKSAVPDVPTPVCDGKYLYMVNDRGIVACLDARSGEVIWGPKRTAVGTVSASPVLADGKLYITNEVATTTVLQAGPEFKVLATNKLNDAYTISSMAVIDSRIFLRTSTHLLCI